MLNRYLKYLLCQTGIGTGQRALVTAPQQRRGHTHQASMQLTLYTDYAIRTLLYLGTRPSRSSPRRRSARRTESRHTIWPRSPRCSCARGSSRDGAGRTADYAWSTLPRTFAWAHLFATEEHKLLECFIRRRAAVHSPAPVASNAPCTRHARPSSGSWTAIPWQTCWRTSHGSSRCFQRPAGRAELENLPPFCFRPPKKAGGGKTPRESRPPRAM